MRFAIARRLSAPCQSWVESSRRHVGHIISRIGERATIFIEIMRVERMLFACISIVVHLVSAPQDQIQAPGTSLIGPMSTDLPILGEDVELILVPSIPPNLFS